MLLQFYLLPAVVICLCIWPVMAALKNFGLGVWGRRFSFVALVTAGLAPSAAPGGIVVVYIPNGVLLALGSPPMLHQEKLVYFALLSFLATAVVSFLLSYLLVRPSKTVGRPNSRAYAAGAVQLVVVAAAFLVFRAVIPDREVAPSINWAFIESVYGERLDRIEAMAAIDDAVERDLEITALREWVLTEPTMVSLKVSGAALKEQVRTSGPLTIGERKLSSGCSSTGDGAWRNDRLMRCSSEFEQRGKLDTLSYKRSSGPEENRVYIEVEFDYDRLLETVDSNETRLALSGSDELARGNDADLIGEWSITDRYERTVNEERFQNGVLSIGPRESFGTYPVRAEVNVESKLRKEDSQFERPECDQTAEQCSYNEVVAGTLRIRGSKVQIIYEHPRWSTDILSLEGNTMLGRANNWGTTTRFERLEERE